jgi:DNA-binding NarL/FixJ family response regulator
LPAKGILMPTVAMKGSAVRVALVEDDPLTRAALIQALRAAASVELVFDTASAVEMMSWIGCVRQSPPDVLLVDLGLLDGTGFEVIRAARRIIPATDVLVVTLFGDEDNMIRAFEAGAKGYLLKDDSSSLLADHVVNLRNGGSPMSPIIARQLIARFEAPQLLTQLQPRLVARENTNLSQDKLLAVTDRELEVLKLIARGYTYPEVAKLLSVAITTVHTHVRHIYGKLAVSSKTEAVFEARQLGLLD